MRKYLTIPVVMTIALLLSCGSEQRYRYVADAPHNTPMPITNNYDATIYPNDLLRITVTSQTPESVRPFAKSGGAQRNEYLVSQSGAIIFPILGRIEAAGKSRAQLAREMETLLISGGYVNDPTVMVELMNFHVTVIGEVQRPQTLTVEGSRLTIFEALARCGDVSMYGQRTNVVVVRSSANSQRVDTLDLTQRAVLDSPYYYLQQNDIVYVEPTEKRKKEAWRESDWLQYINIGVHSVRVAYRTIYHIMRMNR